MIEKALRVLFVCIGNACRSPLAEAIARDVGKGTWDVASAGTSPAGWISPEVVEALEEIGIPADGLRSQGLDEHDLESFSAIVILSGHSADSIVPREFAGEIVDWPLPDPVGRPVEAYRSVRDVLRERIEELHLQLCGRGT